MRKELSENNLNIYTCLNCSTYFPTVPNCDSGKTVFKKKFLTNIIQNINKKITAPKKQERYIVIFKFYKIPTIKGET